MVLLLIFSLYLFGSWDIPTRVNEKATLLIIAGKKSHARAHHEYLKQALQIKLMLEHAENLNNIEVITALDRWPSERELRKAQAIMTISDGKDGDHFGWEVPFMANARRMEQIQEQMDRGCGFITWHFSTFSNDSLGEKVLDWGGGYFDWQDSNGERNWYSSIRWAYADVVFPNRQHPVCKGVKPFTILDEFNYNIRFAAEKGSKITPVVSVPALESENPLGNVVAWTRERADGGRSFCTTMGHVYGNWKIPEFRKLMLNGLVWTMGVEIPQTGVKTNFYAARTLYREIYGGSYNVLAFLDSADQAQSQLISWGEKVDVNVHASHDLNDLFYYDLRDYDALLFALNKGEVESLLPQHAADAFQQYQEFMNTGGSLMSLGHGLTVLTGSDSLFRHGSVLPKLEGEFQHQAPVDLIPSAHPLTQGLINMSFSSPIPVAEHVIYEGARITPLLSTPASNVSTTWSSCWLIETFNADKSRSKIILSLPGLESTSDTTIYAVFVQRALAYITSQGKLWRDL